MFQNEGPFFSWYDNFSSITTVTPTQLAAMPLAGNVTYRPGSVLLKTSDSPRVYAVASDGTLRWVTDQQVLVDQFGAGWQGRIQTIPDAFVTSYAFGPAITSVTGYQIALASSN